MSSINFTWILLFCVSGMAIGGLRQAPLNFTINNRPPNKVPALNPPSRVLLSELWAWYLRMMNLSFRYKHIMAKIHPGRCMAHKSLLTRLCDPGWMLYLNHSHLKDITGKTHGLQCVVYSSLFHSAWWPVPDLTAHHNMLSIKIKCYRKNGSLILRNLGPPYF